MKEYDIAIKHEWTEARDRPTHIQHERVLRLGIRDESYLFHSAATDDQPIWIIIKISTESRILTTRETGQDYICVFPSHAAW